MKTRMAVTKKDRQLIDIVYGRCKIIDGTLVNDSGVACFQTPQFESVARCVEASDALVAAWAKHKAAYDAERIRWYDSGRKGQEPTMPTRYLSRDGDLVTTRPSLDTEINAK